MPTNFLLVIASMATALAVAPSLSGCTQQAITGSYSVTNPNVAELIDLVETENGQLSGRIEAVTLLAGGSVQDRTAAIKGQADGDHLSLLVTPEQFLGQTMMLSAEWNGYELHVSGGGIDERLKRQSLEDFEVGVKAIRTKSAEILAAKARAQSLAEQTRSIYQLKFDSHNLRDQIDLLLARLSRLKPKSQELITTFGLQTQKIERLLSQERFVPDTAERGQVRFAISQVVTETEGAISNVTSGVSDLSNAIGNAKEQAKQIAARCALLVAFNASLSTSCKATSDEGLRLQAAIEQAKPILQDLETTYRRELVKQKQVEMESEQLMN